MSKIWIGALTTLAITAFLFYSWWSSIVRQPFHFSHSLHVKNAISCETCHHNQNDDLPGTQGCLKCHNQMQLPQSANWVKIYRVAPDIIFTHKNHNSIPCATCHQSMSSAKRFMHPEGYTMQFCMDCHSASRANNTCGACHKNR